MLLTPVDVRSFIRQGAFGPPVLFRHPDLALSGLCPEWIGHGVTTASETPRAPARGICGKAKRNSAVATRLRPTGYAAVACRHSSPCFHMGHPGEGE
jgi:hypothetical protein